MRRSCAVLLAAALLSSAAPAAAYQISAQTQYQTGGDFEDSTTEEEVSAIDFRVLVPSGNTIDLSSYVSGASGVLNGRARMDTVGGASGTGEWTALLREDVGLHAAPLTAVVVRGSLQVVTNSSALFFPASAQGHAFQYVRLNIRYGGASPSAGDIQAYGSTRQSSSDGFAWEDFSSAGPPESATAVGSLETGSVDLELHIFVIPGKRLWVEAQVDGEAEAGNHPTSYAESGLDTQLTLDVQGSTYDATFPFFLAPEPDSALLGAVAVAMLAVLRRRS